VQTEEAEECLCVEKMEIEQEAKDDKMKAVE
jgi:hypothetical protein